MAVYSMTGYASATMAQASDKSEENILSVEIRSVNSRFLDIAFKLPEELRQNEAALRTLVTTNLKRGKIEIRAAIEKSSETAALALTPALLQQLKTAEKDIQAVLPAARSLSCADVLCIAGTTTTPAKNTDESAERIQALTQNALRELRESREREGARLAQMLLSHIAQLRDLTRQVGPMIPLLVEQQRNKFLDRWKDALALGHINPADTNSEMRQQATDRALNEATAFAIRIDVAEELTRLASHLDEIEHMLNKGGEIGKKLDFLIQELHREANTLGSKSAILELSRISVDMKVLIEQMREQVQNIE